MASDVVYTAFHDWLVANWTACPLLFENGADKPPADLSPWLYVELTGDMYEQGSIGAGNPAAERWDERGQLYAHCFCAAGKGSLPARQNATALATMLRGLQLAPAIRVGAMNIGDGGVSVDDGNWWGITLRVSWLRN